jgi:hypothetical protein
MCVRGDTCSMLTYLLSVPHFSLYLSALLIIHLKKKKGKKENIA